MCNECNAMLGASGRRGDVFFTSASPVTDERSTGFLREADAPGTAELSGGARTRKCPPRSVRTTKAPRKRWTGTCTHGGTVPSGVLVLHVCSVPGCRRRGTGVTRPSFIRIARNKSKSDLDPYIGANIDSSYMSHTRSGRSLTERIWPKSARRRGKVHGQTTVGERRPPDGGTSCRGTSTCTRVGANCMDR